MLNRTVTKRQALAIRWAILTPLFLAAAIAQARYVQPIAPTVVELRTVQPGPRLVEWVAEHGWSK